MRNSRQFRIALNWILLSIPLLMCTRHLGAVDRPTTSPEPGVRKSGPIELREITSSVNQGTGQAPTFFEGNWGKLGVRELILEIPDYSALLCEELDTWKNGTDWVFHYDIETVKQILRNSGLNESTVIRLTNPPAAKLGIGTTTIFPPDDIILGLTPQIRSFLYPRIGLPVRENKFQNAAQFPSGGFPRLAETSSGLSKQTVDLINHLTYSKKGVGLYFSDLKFVLSKAADDGERFRIVKSIAREISLHPWLELSADSDREEILTYWAADPKNQPGRIALEAILENTKISRLDLVHILPPVPKRLIHTYPEREEGLGNNMPDCFATAFSFFSNSLPPRMLDSESVLEIHSERYERATAPWQFGDVMMIQAPDGQWVHACNFIAGEILFTKNGRSNGRPWVFQTINEVLASYLIEQNMQAFFFRIRPEFRE